MNGPRPPDGSGDVDVAEQNLKRLIAEFGSVLDESLIIPIAEERDLLSGYDEIRQVLAQLAEPAPAEAATGFDSSGLGSWADPEGVRRDETSTSGDGLDSSAEYATTFSEYSDQSENRRVTAQAHLSDEQKMEELQLVFQGRWRNHTLSYVLKNSGGDLQTALDELLNRQYLEESGQLPKGVDGFFASDDGPQPKGKTRRARKANGSKKQTVPVAYKAVSSTVDEGELEGAKDFAGTTSSRQAGRPPPPPPPLAAANGTRAAAALSPTATDFGASHMRAAANLRRMGPLGRQGAVVYTERARDERSAYAAYVSRAAAAHVDRQSNGTMIDLHGVFVMDGVRITRERLWVWWNGLGENRKARAKEDGFTVITGVGRHCPTGVSRLRQTVGAYLRNDGWKFETLTGKFYITGRT